MFNAIPDSLGVILAGGQSLRMGGGDKFLLEINKRPIIDMVIEKARPQVELLALNVNRSQEQFADYQIPLIDDGVYVNSGPIGGIASAMSWAQAHAPHLKWLTTFAADSPLFPNNYGQELYNTALKSQASIVIAQSFGQRHYTFALWPVSALKDLNHYLDSGQRSLQGFFAHQSYRTVDFSRAPDPFFNVNTPDDWKNLQNLLR